MQSEKISVLIPVYNRENFILRAINEIVFQTYENLDIIIYDDGSNDGSREQIISCAIEDSRICYISSVKNHGVGYARNRLLDACNTRYAVWQDSDDLSKPERIEKQLKAMTENKLVYATWENFTSRKAGTTRGFATLMFPVNKNIRFPENMKFGEEDALWREEMEKIYPTTDVNEVLYSIDFHGDRIGSWKRKIDKEWGGKYNLKDIEHLSYEEAIKKYKEEYES